MPKISVIVAIYKAESYLHRCLDSLLSQTFKDFELLLVDDGSPDRSGEICDEYALKDNRIRVFHKENGGVSSARQCGLDNAQGEYVIHADPDDWTEPTMLEELYATAVAEDADMVICDFYSGKSDDQKYFRQQPSALDHQTVLKEMFQQLHGSCWNKLVRRVCYSKYGISFPKEFSLSEDLYTNAALLKNDIRIAYLPKAFYHYIRFENENSIVRKYDENIRQEDFIMLKAFDELTKGNPVFSLAHRQIATAVVYRAFLNSSSLSTVSYIKKYGRFMFDVLLNRNTTILWKFILIISLLGFYHPLFSAYSFLVKRKNND